MANATIAVGTYAGEAARPYVAAAIMSADTLANGYISTMENVHGKAVLRVFSGAAIESATCTFTPGESTPLALGEAVLDTSALQINEQVCNKDLRATWESAQMRGQSSSAPADFTTFAAQYVAAKVAEGIEHNIWSGNYNPDSGAATSATYSAFNGLLRNMVLGTPGYEANLGGVLTASTILPKLALLVANSPGTILGDYDNTKIFMSRATSALYYDALAAVYNLPFLAEGQANKYKAYDVVVPNGFPDDTLLMAQGQNLFFGTNLLTDHINASVLDLQGVTGDDVTRVIMQFSGGTQVVDLDAIGLLRRTT